MHVISKRKLRDFWQLYPDSESALMTWYREAKQAEWGTFAEVRNSFNSVDQVGQFTVFNIGGNKYRLIADIHFNRGKVFVRHVLTHQEYDRGRWQDD
ncbi:MAG: higB [Planctomycetota bacterium]|nr:higB [Planctomycetota bacterium]